MLIESFARCARLPPRCRAMTPTSTTITPTAHPYVARESEPRWYGDGLFEFLSRSDATGGRISVFRATLPEGFSPPRHIHTREDEVFLVLEGEARFDLDGQQARSPAPARACSCRAASRTRSGSRAPSR